MINTYNPNQAPDPDQWLALDEEDAISLIYAYHMDLDEEFPNIQMHAVIHNVVENQAAMVDETPVKKTLERLMKEGLDRHEAIHAVGSVLVDHMWNIQQPNSDPEELNKSYFRKLNKLTVDSWTNEFG